MYLEHLHIQNFKLIGDIQLSFLNTEDFEDADGTQHKKGEPRMFTVLIGKNARGKTSILQAIALAMSKETTANLLMDGRVESSRKINTTGDSIIHLQVYPKGKGAQSRLKIENQIFINQSYDQITDDKKYIFKKVMLEQIKKIEDSIDRVAHHFGYDPSLFKEHLPEDFKKDFEKLYQIADDTEHPIHALHALGHKASFFCGYGSFRTLPLPTTSHTDNPPLNRLQPLFSTTHQINGTNFIEHLRAVDRTPDKAMSQGYLKILEDLISSDLGLLPEIKALRARGTGEIPEEDYLALEHRVVTTIGGHEIEVPTTWLSQGYQAMFSWIADMIGWACLEQKRAVPPAEIEGIALIDEIDLFLHPTWQVRLIPTLKKLFPKVQFIVTTHSPLVLSSLRPDEIVVLELDDETGELVAHNGPGQVPDPRLRTMGELASEFFAINRLYPKALDDMWNEYRRIANDPHRTDEEQARGELLMAQLTAQGKPPAAMVPREEVEQDGWEE